MQVWSWKAEVKILNIPIKILIVLVGAFNAYLKAIAGVLNKISRAIKSIDKKWEIVYINNMLKKEQIIAGAIDLFGYSESDFEGMTFSELKGYLEDQMEEIEAYYAK
mgnify:CR=1 FL=1